MTNEQIKSITLGKYIHVVTTKGCMDIKVKKILTTLYASDAQYSFVAFVSTEGETIYLQTITSISICD